MKDLSKVSVLITTFLRDGSLEKCVNGVLANLPDAKIIIVDDGKESKRKSELYSSLGRRGHKIVIAPFDTGLAEKRNMGVKVCETDYLLMGCDDFVFDGPAREGIEKLQDILDENENITIASGRVNNNPYEGDIEVAPGKYIKEHRLIIEGDKPFYKCQLTVNYFLARLYDIKDIPWDGRMKIGGEHGDWFLSLKEQGKNVVWVPSVNINVLRMHVNGDDPTYQSYRARARDLGHKIFLEKRGVQIHLGFDDPIPKGTAETKKEILIAVVSCHKNREWQQHVRKNWLQFVPKGVDAKFFLGNGAKREPDGDEVFLDCSDAYEGLSEKVKAICTYAHDHGYLWMFKVDDDTEVFVERLLLENLDSDYIGRLNGCWGGYASGGSGYWLSARALAIIAKQPLSGDTAEDRWVGSVLRAHGIVVEPSKRYTLDLDGADPRVMATLCHCKDAPWKTPLPPPVPIVPASAMVEPRSRPIRPAAKENVDPRDQVAHTDGRTGQKFGRIVRLPRRLPKRR